MTSIQMPQLGETIVEGTILKWLKQEGEHVERDEPLFEISTDKVDTEVPSPVAGTVAKILVAEGETVAVGTELATVDDGAGAAAPVTSAAEASAPPSQMAAVPAAPATPAAPAATAATTVLPDRGPRSQIVSPVVRRLAQEHAIDLSTIAGTGEGGRITRKDVERAIGTAGAMPTAPPAPAAAVAPMAASAPAPVPPLAQGVATGEERRPMTHIRRAIAEHMHASVQTTARAWTMVEVNVEHLVRLRTQEKERFRAKHGVNLTYLPFVVRATVDALQEYPYVNARLDGDDIVIPRAVHMAIAVSYDAGLIVPVIKNADAMNTVGIARAIADLAARARAHQLQPDEVQGGTFTITNPGPYGSVASVPIINTPNVAILSLDAIVRRPVVIDDAIAIRSMVNVSMSWDHRLIDGELATRFLVRVQQNLESWDFAEDLGL
jgi:2-oxoglutarate dehydrogenase dihydrolipoamide succinyltransferase (E2 component)